MESISFETQGEKRMRIERGKGQKGDKRSREDEKTRIGEDRIGEDENRRRREAKEKQTYE